LKSLPLKFAPVEAICEGEDSLQWTVATAFTNVPSTN